MMSNTCDSQFAQKLVGILRVDQILNNTARKRECQSSYTDDVELCICVDAEVGNIIADCDLPWIWVILT